MPRSYKRKSSRQNWSVEQLESAIKKVIEGSKITDAALEFGIPRETLRRKVIDYKSNENFTAKKGLGYVTVFTEDQEMSLYNEIIEYDARLHGFTAVEVRRLAFQHAENLKLRHNFDKTTRLAGVDWFRNFIKRHPDLALRKPEPTSIARANGFNKKSVETFFNLLDDLYKKYNFLPENIYNVDETGVSCNPKTYLKVVSLKGKRQVGAKTSAERGTTVTACICLSATGKYMPPTLIFPRVRENKSFLNGAPPGSVAEFNGIGWMDTEIFTKWLKRFIEFSGANSNKPVLLLVDGHSTHVKNLEAIKLAKENNVTILRFPPHCTHRMQPLDVSYMKPLSNYYSAAVHKWMRENPNSAIGLKDIFSIFNEAYVKASTMENAVNGFKKTGIYPFNSNIFSDCEFAAKNTVQPSLENQHSETSDVWEKTSSFVSNSSDMPQRINIAQEHAQDMPQHINIAQEHAQDMPQHINIAQEKPQILVNNVNIDDATPDQSSLKNSSEEILDTLENIPIVFSTNESLNQTNEINNDDAVNSLVVDFKTKVEKFIDKNLQTLVTNIKKVTTNNKSNVTKRKRRAPEEAAVITSAEYETGLSKPKIKKAASKNCKKKVLAEIKNKPPIISNIPVQYTINLQPIEQQHQDVQFPNQQSINVSNASVPMTAQDLLSILSGPISAVEVPFI